MKKIKTTIVILIIMLVIVTIVYNINKNNNKGKPQEIVESYVHEEELGLTGLIDNEEYYYEKQKEYNTISEEYEELVKKIASEQFTEEQKKVIEEYQEKLTKAAQSGNKEEKIKLSHEYVKLHEEYRNKSFSSEQLKIVNTKKEKMEELESIVDEYQEKLAIAQEEKSKEGLETLSDGKIKSNREGILSEKTYDGLKFSDIQLVYNPATGETTIEMTITNDTNEARGNKLVTLNFTGNTECKYLMRLEEVSSGEHMKIEFPMKADLRDTDTFEIIDFNENDYQKV